MKVCIFGTFDHRRHPRIAVIEDGLNAAGLDVVRCNVPWNAPTDLRVAALRRPHLLVVLAFRLAVAWIRLIIGARRVGRLDAVIVGYLGVLDVHLAALLWRRATVVLDHLAPVLGTVDDRAPGRGLLLRLAAVVDSAAVRRADLVVVDTEEHRVAPAPSVVVPVGAEMAWFAARRPDRHVESPLRLVFFGLFTPLQGAPVIAEAVRRLLDADTRIAVAMIGRGQELATCRELLGMRPEVRWEDWVDPADLPRIVAAHDVCLGIFGQTPKALRVVPNKVFQGAAAGCALVTSDTAPQRRALGEAALFVPAGDARALADALRQLESDRALLSEMRRRAGDVADRDFRADTIVAPLLGRLRQAVDDR